MWQRNVCIPAALWAPPERRTLPAVAACLGLAPQGTGGGVLPILMELPASTKQNVSSLCFCKKETQHIKLALRIEEQLPRRKNGAVTISNHLIVSSHLFPSRKNMLEENICQKFHPQRFSPGEPGVHASCQRSTILSVLRTPKCLPSCVAFAQWTFLVLSSLFWINNVKKSVASKEKTMHMFNPVLVCASLQTHTRWKSRFIYPHG